MKTITLNTEQWSLISQGVPSFTQIRNHHHIKVYVSLTAPSNDTDAYFTCEGAFSYHGEQNIYMMVPDNINDVEGTPITEIKVVVGKGN